ncbi:SH3 beta-barrel fold-containing protein [Bacteroides sp.]|uniref:SH3 beta-barrel fold-containing protein n=1 Tax=Bacteroides sp. TaxID=29523 RepID=UPI00262CEBC0|nr:SH3 beta-barrel fold-containing protein [Bacteroides sp.]
METKSNFRTRVMKYAHHLLNTTRKSWKYCMLKAWELYRLAKRMRDGSVKFAYEKTDGSIRYACGTLQNLPAGSTIRGKKMTKPSYKTFAYYDIAKSEMRCFKIENLVTVY